MGVDAVALLRIPKLEAPRSAFGAAHLVQHRGKASLLHTFNRFDGTAADEHALAVRQLLGSTLDAHDDPRGILIFPDVCEPKARSYDAIVRELGSAGVWAPKVGLDHVPARYTHAKADSHESLVAQMVSNLGRDKATQLDMMAQVYLAVIGSTNGRADAVAEYAAILSEIKLAMGHELAQAYEASLRRKLEADSAAQVAHFERARQLHARVMGGSPTQPDKKKKR